MCSDCTLILIYTQHVLYRRLYNEINVGYPGGRKGGQLSVKVFLIGHIHSWEIQNILEILTII